MIKALLVRGLVAGLIAGLAAGIFGSFFGEPLIDDAIAIEEAGLSPAELAAPAEVSRDGQKIGLVVATALYGTALGGLFALAFAVVRGRIRARNDLWLAGGLAAALFTAVVLIPFLKYPANPPAVGDPATITERTVLYYTMVATGLLALLAGWRVARRVSEDSGRGVRAAAGIGVFGVTVGLAFLVLPGVSEVPADFPAGLLAEFRWASIGLQAVMWATLGLVFGASVKRTRARTAERTRARPQTG